MFLFIFVTYVAFISLYAHFTVRSSSFLNISVICSFLAS
jgi:hypothetical protein